MDFYGILQKGDSYMRILGIDPGLAIVGWAVLDSERGQLRPVAFGAITTPAHTPVESRLLMIKQDLETVIDKYSPTEMAVEELFFNTNSKTAIVVAEARGIIILAAKLAGIEIGEYTPLQVKQAVVGYGRAEKKQVITLVGMILGMEHAPKLDDTADALALAICHAHTGGSRMRNYFNEKKKRLL